MVLAPPNVTVLAAPPAGWDAAGAPKENPVAGLAGGVLVPAVPPKENPPAGLEAGVVDPKLPKPVEEAAGAPNAGVDDVEVEVLLLEAAPPKRF